MTNAVFDLSNMFFRSMFIVGGFGKKQYTFDSQKEQDQLMRKVAMDVTSVIRSINPSRVIITLDSRSWRKNISIDENEGYKGNRTKSETINWENFYKIMDDFSAICKANGFIISKVQDAEADDLMALWRDKLLYEDHQHVILVSGDEDVRQLVTTDIHEKKISHSVVFNPFTQGKNATKKLFSPIGFNDWLNGDDDLGNIFDRSIDVDKEDFMRILNEQVKLEEIDGNEIALKKMFCGDDGDNVPSIYTWMAKTAKGEDKTVRITKAKYERIIDFIGAKDPNDLFEKSEPIMDQITEIAGHKPPFKIEDRLTRQAKLVVLDAKFFPSKIVSEFFENVDEQLEVPHVNPQSLNMLSMLEGTRYVDATKSSKSSGGEASIFGQIDRISNKALF